MDTYSLATDPSFKSFIPGGQETPNDSRVLLQLYECQEQEEPLSWMRKHSKSTKWVAIIHTRQMQGQLKRVFAKTVTCVARFDKGDSVCLKKGWWTSGERRTTRAKGPYEIWKQQYGIRRQFHVAGSSSMDTRTGRRQSPDTIIPQRIARIPIQQQKVLQWLPQMEYTAG
jgi:hypothetical protein